MIDKEAELEKILGNFHAKFNSYWEDLENKVITAREWPTVRANIFSEATKAILAYLTQAKAEAALETEKAFGGCKKCYGKGYATVLDYSSGTDTDTDIGSPGGSFKHQNSVMRYCTCDRGKQLNQLKSKGEAS